MVYDKIPAYRGEQPYIFVSYSHKDSSVVLADIERLINEGWRVWYDEGIEYGSNFRKEIGKALDKCSQFMVYISQNSIESDFVCKEIYFALDEKKPILPIYLERTSLPLDLKLELSGTQGLMKYEMTSETYIARLPKGLQQECRGQTVVQPKSTIVKNQEFNTEKPILMDDMYGNIVNNSYVVQHVVQPKPTVVKTQEFTDDKTFMVGNTYGNIINWGQVAQQGEWIYYRNESKWSCLYKMKLDGSERTKLTSCCSNITVVGEWIY